MKSRIAAFAAATLAVPLMDAVWLGLVATDFYRRELASVLRLAPDRSMDPLWWPVVPVYLALGVLFAFFADAPGASVGRSAARGALVGLCVYAVYDFTNLSLLNGWSLPVTLADVAWGAVVGAGATAAAALARRAVR